MTQFKGKIDKLKKKKKCCLRWFTHTYRRQEAGCQRNGFFFIELIEGFRVVYTDLKVETVEISI